MSDVRALLKAKTQERAKRISHPYAAYNASNQLRCSLCATNVKDNDIAWSGHLNSKGHRTNVGRQKELAEQESAKARLEKGKRKALVEDDEDEDDEDGAEMDEGQNVRGTTPLSKRQKTEEEQRSSSKFPSGFFSDPTRSIPTVDDDDEEQAEDTQQDSSNSKPKQQSDRPAPKTQIDEEWDRFERDILTAVPPNRTSQAEVSRKDIYERATIVGEEQVLYDPTEGIPEHLRSTNADQQPESLVNPDGGPEETPQQVTERRQRDEKELIMDRIMDEERAQEDADEKVRALKARLAQVKKKREELKKLNKNQEGSKSKVKSNSSGAGQMDIEQ